MNKKIAVIIAVIIAIVLISLAVINLMPVKEAPYYSDDPTTWVDKKSGGVKEVNIDKITVGDGYLNSYGEQYISGDISTVFDYDGVYKGNYVRDEYVDDNDNVLFSVTNDLNPTNGVIEGFIVMKIENDQPFTYIFVDEDWKNELGAKTNIVWGADYEKIRKFEFNEISDGIYMDQIEDDRSRFSANYREHSGGVIAGDLTLKDVENKTIDGLTFIRMY